MQMLFQWDITKDDINSVVDRYWANHEEPGAEQEFSNRLVRNTVNHVEDIDRMLERHAENWRLDRMAAVDRNVLRLATEELVHDATTPASVIINEAIEVARRFSAKESPQFINGILDSIRKEVNR